MSTLETKIIIVGGVVYRHVPVSCLRQNLSYLNVDSLRDGDRKYASRMITQLIQSKVQDFYVPVLAPSIDNQGCIRFEKGKKPAFSDQNGSAFYLDPSINPNWSEKLKAINDNIKAPHFKMKLQSATKIEYYALLLNIVYEMSCSGYSNEDAWKTIFKWRNTHMDSLTGSGEDVCGWGDVTNWGWVFLDDNDSSIYWQAGYCECLNGEFERFRPLVSLEERPIKWNCRVGARCLCLSVLKE